MGIPHIGGEGSKHECTVSTWKLERSSAGHAIFPVWLFQTAPSLALDPDIQYVAMLWKPDALKRVNIAWKCHLAPCGTWTLQNTAAIQFFNSNTTCATLLPGLHCFLASFPDTAWEWGHTAFHSFISVYKSHSSHNWHQVDVRWTWCRSRGRGPTSNNVIDHPFKHSNGQDSRCWHG